MTARQPLLEAQVQALRVRPLNLSRMNCVRESALRLGATNVLGLIAMLRMVQDCPERAELLRAIGDLGIDLDREFTWEDVKRVLDGPTF